MKKLIKLSDTHYIIVDDSEIKEGGIFIHPDKTIERASRDLDGRGLNKITYSTQPLENIVTEDSFKSYNFISLSEVEEVIYGYSLEKMVEEKYSYNLSSNARKKGFIEGFKAHQELVKDKLFTIEDIKKAIKMAWEADSIDGIVDLNIVLHYGNNDDLRTKWSEEEIIQSLLPKTEWDIEISENNKITLL